MGEKMSKTKSKPSKNSAKEVWCVDVYEHEKGWGERLEDHFEFPSEEEANTYFRKATAEFSKQGDSDCFALAHRPYKKETQ